MTKVHTGPYLEKLQKEDWPFDKCFLVAVFKELMFQA